MRILLLVLFAVACKSSNNELLTEGAQTSFKEDSLTGFDQPYEPMPAAEANSYIIENIAEVGTDSLNYIRSTLKEVEIAGKHVIIKPGHPNDIYDKYDQKTDIRSFKVYAETLTIGAEFRLYQTNVEIFARRIIFEGPASSIITTPLSKATTVPVQFASGANGLRAGNMFVWVEKYTDSIKRFIAKGGNGQPAGVGKDGDNGDSMATIPYEVRLKSYCPTGCDRYCPGIKEQVTNAVYVNNMYLGRVPDCVRGERRWPSNGDSAKPGGAPGEGGHGGVFMSNIDIANNADVTCGLPGKKADDYKGGLPGTPNPAYQIVHQTKSRERGGGTEFVVYRHEQVKGKDATSPSPKQPIGSSGNITIKKEDKYAWLHPRYLEMIISHAEDLYLLKYYKQADLVFSEYSNILKQAIASGAGNAQLPELQHRFERNHIQILHGLDYFGNPPGWAPVLSLELYKSVFEQEIKKSIGVLFLTHWFGKDLKNAATRSELLKETINTTKNLIEADLDKYNNIVVKELPKIESSLELIDHERKYLLSQAKIREQELADQATDNIEERKRKEQERKAWRMFGAMVGLLPVGTPFAGVAGSAIQSFADKENLWDAAGNMINAYSSARNYNKSLDKYNTAYNNTDFSSAEKLRASLEKSKKDREDALGDILKHIYTELSEAAKNRAPVSEFEAELKKLKASDPQFSELLARLEKLKTKRVEVDELIVTTKQSMAETLERISVNQGILLKCSEELSKAIAGFDLSTKNLIGQMRRNAFKQLRYYHYQFARAFEYRLLLPYRHSLLLDYLYNEFEKIADANRTQLTDKEIASLMVPYREQLSNVTNEVVRQHESGQLEDEIYHTIVISEEEKARLNKGDTIEVDLASREEFLNKKEQNRRIIHVQASVANLNKKGTLDIVMYHGGTSSFDLSNNAHTFRHLGYNGKNRLIWKSRIDTRFKNRPPNHSQPSEDSKSLLYTFLEQKEKSVLFHRPGVNARLFVCRSAADTSLKITDLGIEIKYTYVNAEN